MVNKTHSFSPITNETRFNEAMEYVAINSLSLARTVLSRELAIDTICFFAQTQNEYDYLHSVICGKGTASKFSHGPTTYVDTDLKVASQSIKILGVRRPDLTRPWIGYGDYPITDEEYMAIKASGNQYVEEIVSGRDEPLLELKHPDFDVLGYAFCIDDHS